MATVRIKIGESEKFVPNNLLSCIIVMTSVYGVTFIGAKKQIQEKIEEKVCMHACLSTTVI